MPDARNQSPTSNLQPPLLTETQRWTIVGLLAASITINLLDRQTLSVLAPLLREQWKWTNAQYGYIAVAFNLGMMLGQIPAGQLMDRVGTRIGLPIIFTAWSLICAAHAFAGPFPPATRSRAGGMFNAGAQLGSVIAPSLILSLLVVQLGVSWKAAFLIPPALGLLWLIP